MKTQAALIEKGRAKVRGLPSTVSCQRLCASCLPACLLASALATLNSSSYRLSHTLINCMYMQLAEFRAERQRSLLSASNVTPATSGKAAPTAEADARPLSHSYSHQPRTTASKIISVRSGIAVCVELNCFLHLPCRHVAVSTWCAQTMQVGMLPLLTAHLPAFHFGMLVRVRAEAACEWKHTQARQQQRQRCTCRSRYAGNGQGRHARRCSRRRQRSCRSIACTLWCKPRFFRCHEPFRLGCVVQQHEE